MGMLSHSARCGQSSPRGPSAAARPGPVRWPYIKVIRAHSKQANLAWGSGPNKLVSGSYSLLPPPFWPTMTNPPISGPKTNQPTYPRMKNFFFDRPLAVMAGRPAMAMGGPD